MKMTDQILKKVERAKKLVSKASELLMDVEYDDWEEILGDQADLDNGCFPMDAMYNIEHDLTAFIPKTRKAMAAARKAEAKKAGGK